MNRHSNRIVGSLGAVDPTRIVSEGLQSAVAALILTAALQVVADQGENQDAIADGADCGVAKIGPA